MSTPQFCPPQFTLPSRSVVLIKCLIKCCPSFFFQDHEGKELGVAGSVELVASRNMSSQPVCSLDWSPDKEGLFCCAAFDQTLRVGIVTKLKNL